MASSDVQSKIGAEDIKFADGGTGAAETFTRRTSTGGNLTLEKVDATHLQLRSSAISVEDSINTHDHPQYINHSLATAVNDFLVASGAGIFVKKTLAETKKILGVDFLVVQVFS